jgi:hypothetical protein
MQFNDAVAQLCGGDWENGARGTRLHEDVLLALLPASRTQDGRLALGASPGAIEAIARILRDPLVFLEPIGLLAVRLLRNLCARSVPNQQRAAQVGAHALVLDCIKRRVDSCDALESNGGSVRVPAAVRRIEGDDAEISAGRLRRPFFPAAVEFLCNFATCNSANANLVWDRAFPELFFSILECGNDAVAAAGAALLHNCIAATPERASDLVRIWTEDDSEGGRSLAKSLVRKLHGTQDDGAGASFSWAFMVIRRLVGAGLVENVFNVIGPSLREIDEVGGASFSPYQMTLLGVLEAATGESAENVGLPGGAECSVPDASLPFFATLMTVSWRVRDGSVFRLAASIAGSLAILAPDADGIGELKLKAAAEAVNALVALYLEARGGERAMERRPAPRGSGADGAASDGESIAGLRGAAVRLVALAAHRDRAVQDMVRDMSGLVPVLGALSYERDTAANPFLREWAVVAVRNLCCGNEENAREISKLELVDVQSNGAALSEAGLEAFMDSDGRPRVRVKVGGS